MCIRDSYFKSLTDHSVSMAREDFKIHLSADKDNRLLTLSDNGIGMTREELENNLGTIAKSGSLNFKKENDLQDDVEIIGQFGVGFYAAFMVSSEVTVISRAFGSDEAYRWNSSGADGYTVEPCTKESFGTDVILKIKENTEEEKFDEYLEQYRLQSCLLYTSRCV